MGESAIGMIMAGGLGSRMARSHPFAPKPLVHIAGVPLLEIAVGQLLRAGVATVHVALRHEAERIQRWVATLPSIAADRLQCVVEPEPLGTVGALWFVRDVSCTVAVMNGDLLSGVDLAGLFARHRELGADLTIATHPEFHRLKLGEVVVGPDHRVLDYLEKPVKEYRISSGIYLLEPSVLGLLQRREWLGFPDLAKRAIAAGLRVCEHYDTAAWFDVNDSADLEQAEAALRRDPVAFGLTAERVRA